MATPKENAQAERINSTVKNELLKGMEFTSIGQVREELEKRVPYYNNRRPHMSLSYYTPAEAMGQQGVIKKKWHSYRDEAILKEKEKKMREGAAI